MAMTVPQDSLLYVVESWSISYFPEVNPVSSQVRGSRVTGSGWNEGLATKQLVVFAGH